MNMINRTPDLRSLYLGEETDFKIIITEKYIIINSSEYNEGANENR